ncbi:hypothetical protein ACFQIA_10295 [Halalkalicoccus sp. GCM10025704]
MMNSDSGTNDEPDSVQDQNRDQDRTRRRSRREIDRAIDDLAGSGPTPTRTESWRRFIGLDLDADDPLHRRWITAGAEGDMTDADARRAIERFNGEDVDR